MIIFSKADASWILRTRIKNYLSQYPSPKYTVHGFNYEVTDETTKKVTAWAPAQETIDDWKLTAVFIAVSSAKANSFLTMKLYLRVSEGRGTETQVLWKRLKIHIIKGAISSHKPTTAEYTEPPAVAGSGEYIVLPDPGD